MLEEPKQPTPTTEWGAQSRGAEFHLDPEKQKDPVEKLVETHGPEDAAETLLNQLEKDPSNPELRRQATLLANKYQDLAEKIRGEISH